MSLTVCGDAPGLCHINEEIGAPEVSAWCDLCKQVCGLPHDLVEGIAHGVVGRWNRYNAYTIDPEDARQEAWLAYFENRTSIDDHLSRGGRDDARRIIRDHVWRFCRREKAARCGYDPEDDFFYGLTTLRRLLPAVYGGDVAQEGGKSVEPRRRPQGGATSGSDSDTMTVDVRWGLEQMSKYDRVLLYDVYSQPRGETTHPDYTRARAALVRLQHVLGGPAH